MTKLVHGERGLWAAKDAASVFFDKKLMSMSANQLVEMSRDARQIVISRNDICRITLIDLLVYIGAAKSKGKSVIYMMFIPHFSQETFVQLKLADLSKEEGLI
jgi:hypothetical protein